MAKILVVDDTRSIREVVRMHLDLDGHEVVEAQNGRQAIQMAEEHQPDVIVLDIMMPEMDGLEACRIIRERPRIASAYIIMLSAMARTKDKVFGLDTGADAYLTKPFEPEELKAMVRAGLRILAERREAMYDRLTGLYNRRTFDLMIDHEIGAAKRHGHGLAVVMIDFDHFKSVNDNYGHDVGDQVLKELASLLKRSSRPSDMVFRWGGEEFVLLMPHTGTQEAIVAAERVRERIAEHSFGPVGSKTVSMGVYVSDGREDAHDIFRKADKALYTAKANGRNRVEVFS